MDHRDMRRELQDMVAGMELYREECFYQTNPTEKCGCV